MIVLCHNIGRGIVTHISEDMSCVSLEMRHITVPLNISEGYIAEFVSCRS